VESCEELRKKWNETQKPSEKVKNRAYKAGKIVACLEECHDGNAKKFVEATQRRGLSCY